MCLGCDAEAQTLVSWMPPLHNNRVFAPFAGGSAPRLKSLHQLCGGSRNSGVLLGRRACQHLLHDVMENATHRKIPKSRRPLTRHAQQLVSSVPPQETVKQGTHASWAELWASNTTRLHQFMPTPSNSGHGVGLSRRAWTRLTRLRTAGVGRFGANILRWGLSTNDSCDCHAEQTADHITSGGCPIYRPLEGSNGIIDLDDETRAQLEDYSGRISGV